MAAVQSELLQTVEDIRIAATANLDDSQRGELGQFLTPAPVARLMASMISVAGAHIRILEPGAGAGSLIAAAVEHLLQRPDRPAQITVHAYELDGTLLPHLRTAMALCEAACADAAVAFTAHAIEGDFIAHASAFFAPDLFGALQRPEFDLVITNPPYRKINTDSEHRRLLRMAGVEASNLYSGFMGLAVQLLAHGGEIIAITPRSFCNGSYFRPFRELLLDTVAFRRVHIFESRKEAFKGDSVLQENIIWHGVRGADASDLLITSGDSEVRSSRTVPQARFVTPGDPELYMHIVPEEAGDDIAATMHRFQASLKKLGLSVSTGRVVDFRAKAQLRSNPEEGAAPLIYPTHLAGGVVTWPKEGKKPNALHVDDYTRPQLVQDGNYVIVKRFSSKEERRRVVATVYRQGCIPAPLGVGFENKLNYFHNNGVGLELNLAKGLAVFLNSSLVDSFFRQFSGHTQVNAGDLKKLPYPTSEQLIELGRQAGDGPLGQDETDALLHRLLQTIADRTQHGD